MTQLELWISALDGIGREVRNDQIIAPREQLDLEMAVLKLKIFLHQKMLR